MFYFVVADYHYIFGLEIAMRHVLRLELKQGLGHLPSNVGGQRVREGGDILIIVVVVVTGQVVRILSSPLASPLPPRLGIGQHRLLLREEVEQIPAVGVLQHQEQVGPVVEVSLAAQDVGVAEAAGATAILNSESAAAGWAGGE